VRDRLGGRREVVSVAVRAVPAITLLWGRADRVSAQVRTYDLRGADVAEELARTAGVTRLDVRIARVEAGHGVVLQDVEVRKRGRRLSATALLDGAQLTAALPGEVGARLVPEPDGSVVVAAGAGGSGRLRARVEVRDGRVVVRPDGLLGLVAAVTVFDDPRIEVLQLTAEPRDDGSFALGVEALVR
jgi:hypothetical protein